MNHPTQATSNEIPRRENTSVYLQGGVLFSEKMSRISFDAIAKGNPDAIVYNTYSHFFNTKTYSLADSFRELDEAGILVVLMNSSNDPAYQREVRKAKEAGAIEVEATPLHQQAIRKCLEAIVEQEKKETGTRREQNERIKKRTKEIFSNPQFYDSLDFLELVVDPKLRRYANNVSPEESIVIDCGHIDSENFDPTFEDVKALEDGIILFKYLKMRGHKNVKIGFFFNEMHIFKKRDLKGARRIVKKEQRFAREHGLSQLLATQYQSVITAYGIPASTWKEHLMVSFEGSLKFACRQDLDAYHAGDTERFKVSIGQTGNTSTYEHHEPEYDETFVRELTSEKGAPICNFLSAKLNQRYEQKGFDRVIYLYGLEGANGKTRDCGIRGGVLTARQVYGTQIKVDVMFYHEIDQVVHTTDVIRL